MNNYPPPSWFCPACGHQNQLSFKHCTECGTALPSGAPVSQLPKPAVKKSGLSLVWWVLIGMVIVSGFLVAVITAISTTNTSGVRPDSSPVSSRPVPTPTPGGITMENYGRIRTGMTYSEVVGILGKEGAELSSSDMAGYKTTLYQWQGVGIGNMNVMFQNGKMIQKAQFGLQ